MPKRSLSLLIAVVLTVAAGFAAYRYLSEAPAEAPQKTATTDVADAAPEYVGRSACVACHAEANNDWTGSHHDLAMQIPDENTVLGNFGDATFAYNGITSNFFKRNDKFIVNTDGPDGTLQDYEVKYVFGVEPLQQYLLELPGGRLQSLSIAWDTRLAEQGGQRWFHLYPDEKVTYEDELHWTTVNQNWNYMCAECHSTDLQKNFSIETNSYATTYSEIDVSCEACHGPGSEHVRAAQAGDEEAFEAPGNGGLVTDFKPALVGRWLFPEGESIAALDAERDTNGLLDVCAQCHSRRTTIRADVVHKETFYDSHLLSVLEPGLYHADGQIDDEVYVFGSFMQSKMHAAGVTCVDCHEPHSLKLRANDNSLCAQCHLSTTYNTRAHHMHAAGLAGTQCVDCHMPDKNYMVIDARRDHSFRVPRPDLTVKTGSPNACNGCHANRTAEWAVAAIQQLTGRDEFEFHFGEAIFAGRSQAVDARELLQRIARDEEQPAIARATATSMLGAFPAGESIYTLRVGLNSPDPLVRIGALEGTAGMEIQERYNLAGRLLSDPVRSVRMAAVGQLAGINRVQLTAAQQREFLAAVDEYIEIQNENADRGYAHTNLGNLYIALGEIDRALAEYQLAIEIEPQFMPGYINLADYYRATNQEAQAEEALRQALTINAEFGGIYHALGLSLARQEDYDGALENLREAAKLGVDNPQHQYVYAIALTSVQQTKEGLEVLAAAHQRWPGNRQLLSALMTLNRELGNTDAAVGYGIKLLQLTPDDQGLQQYLMRLQQQ